MTNLSIAQGSTFERVFKWCNPVTGSDPPVANPADPVDITGYAAKIQFRARAGEADSVAPLFEVSVGSGLTINGPAGTITMVITDEQTEALTFTSGVWDLLLESPTGKQTVIPGGHVSVTLKGTR